MGEDAFLTEEGSANRQELPLANDEDAGLDDVQGEWELDELVDDLHNEWCKLDVKNSPDYHKQQHTDVSSLKSDAVCKVLSPGMEQQHSQLLQSVLQQEKAFNSAAVRVSQHQTAAGLLPISKCGVSDKACTRRVEQQQFQQKLQPVLQPVIVQNSASESIPQQQTATADSALRGIGPWNLEWLSKMKASEAGNVSPSNCLFVNEHESEANWGKNCDDSYTFMSKKSKGGNVKCSVGFIKRKCKFTSHLPQKCCGKMQGSALDLEVVNHDCGWI